MSTSPTVAEVERAKSQLKAATLLSLSDDGTKSIVEDIARNIFTYGTRLTPKQVEEAIDAVTIEDIIRVYVLPHLLPPVRSCPTADLSVPSFLLASQRQREALGPGHRHRRHGPSRGSVRLPANPKRHEQYDVLKPPPSGGEEGCRRETSETRRRWKKRRDSRSKLDVLFLIYAGFEILFICFVSEGGEEDRTSVSDGVSGFGSKNGNTLSSPG